MPEIDEDFDFNEDLEFYNETPGIPSQWIKGYNEGYFIAKYMPELSLLLSTAQGDSRHLRGLNEGRNQYLLDKTKEHLHWRSQRPKDNRLVTEKSNEFVPLNFDEGHEVTQEQNNELRPEAKQGYIQYLKKQVKDKLSSWPRVNSTTKMEKHPDKGKERDIEPEPN